MNTQNLLVELFVEELPHTATGKILKRQIRDDYKDYKLRSLVEA